MSKPVLAVGLLAVMAGAWYWALLPPVAPAAPVRDAARPVGAAAGTFPAVRLDRLAAPAATAPPGPSTRDPFRAGGAIDVLRPVPAAGRSPRAAGAPAAPDDAPAPTWPRVDLIGIAEGRDGAVLVRTAIVSGPAGVHHVRAGDLVEGVYRVERIGADGVDIRLVPEDRLVRLTLRP